MNTIATIFNCTKTDMRQAEEWALAYEQPPIIERANDQEWHRYSYVVLPQLCRAAELKIR